MTKPNYTYRQDHIPKSTACNRRTGLALQATSITIHNTGNPTSTAANERAWLTNPSNTRTASYHIVVDAREAIEVLPLHEVAWHAGDGSNAKSGNRTSIAIEICERSRELGEYDQALANAIELTAAMLKQLNWGVERLRRHFDWSGKLCPRLMNQDGNWTGWKQFVQRVEARLIELNDVSMGDATTRNIKKTDEAIIIVNGKQLQEKGQVKNGVTYVPIRAIAEALGATVTWDGSLQTVTIVKPNS